MDRLVLDSAGGVQPVNDRFAPRASCVDGFPARDSWLAGCSRGLVCYAVTAGQKPHRRRAGSVAEFASGDDRRPGPDRNAG
jgi:hypothetical protein